jgi:hypothetical protein
MTKFKVGDQVSVSTTLRITGTQQLKTGEMVYNTDHAFSIRESILKNISADIKQDKQEPIKLYCVRDYKSGRFLTKGKVYTVEHKGGKDYLKYDGWTSCFYNFNLDEYKNANPDIGPCLVPLVARPAKVGEWVYVTRRCYSALPCGLYKIEKQYHSDGWGVSGEIKADGDGLWCVSRSEYLVLDGYKPEPEKCKCCGRILE